MNDVQNTGWTIIIVGAILCFTGVGLILGIPVICVGYNMLNSANR